MTRLTASAFMTAEIIGILLPTDYPNYMKKNLM